MARARVVFWLRQIQRLAQDLILQGLLAQETLQLLSGSYQAQSGERVGVLLSGGNTIAVNFDS